MPIYYFRCKTKGCENEGTFSLEHPFGAPHPNECPVCGGMLTRRFTAPNVHYRGSGFTVNDMKANAPTEDDIIEAKLDRILAGKSPD